MFLCGSLFNTKKIKKTYSNRIHPQLKEDDLMEWEICSTPRKSRKHSLCRRKDTKNNNPYSNRGLDIFSTLLAELDDKRQKIYIQKGSEDISYVRFVYSDSNDFMPIVVKRRDKQQNKTMSETKKDVTYPINALTDDHNEVIQQISVKSTQKSSEKNIFSKRNIMRSYYLPAIIIFILFFLAVFGRTFTILCVSVGWYFMSTIKQWELHRESSKINKKKEIKSGRKSIDGIYSPRSVIRGRNEQHET